jgi:WD40 repeat protein
MSSSTGDATEVVSIEVDEPRRRFATVGEDRKIRIRSLDGDAAPVVLPWEVDPALGCRFAPNGELVAIGWNDGVRIWRGPETTVASSGLTISSGPEHRGRITGFDVGYDVIFTCSEDRAVRMWNLGTGDQEAVVYGFNAFRSISAAGDEIVVGDDAGEVWRMVRNFGTGLSWSLVVSSEDSEFGGLLRATLKKADVSTSSHLSEGTGLLVVLGASAPGTDAAGPFDLFASKGRPVISIVLGEAVWTDVAWASGLTPRVDFRRWRDPYEFAARFRELLERMDRGTASPQTSA